MSDLLACNIIEKDDNDDILWAWTYPKVTEKEKNVILRKCSFETPNFLYFGRYYMKWFYILTLEVSDAPNLENVKNFACVLWARDFNPDKYEKLCRIMCKTYLDSGNAVSLLQLYLSVVTKGVCSAKDNGTFVMKEFNSLKKETTMVKDLIKMFGLEVILIYTVILLKKKLVVYHHSLPTLLQWMPSFPALMVHRNITGELYPWLELVSEDFEQLKASSSYIAGFADNSIISRTDLFDVIVNLPAREISVSAHAKENLGMTKIHKDIALFMVQLAESDHDEAQIAQAISDKTQELLSQLRSLGRTMDDGKCMVYIESLKDKNISPAMENFFFQLALAENMLIL